MYIYIYQIFQQVINKPGSLYGLRTYRSGWLTVPLVVSMMLINLSWAARISAAMLPVVSMTRANVEPTARFKYLSKAICAVRNVVKYLRKL